MSGGMTIDARGLKCPLPVLKTEKALATLSPGEKLIVLADDPVARVDIPLYCKKNGYECVLTSGGNHMRFAISA